MDAGVIFLVVAAMTLLTVVAVWALRRGLTGDRARRGSGFGDALGNTIDVFDPGASRAARDLQEQRHSGPVTPVPDPEAESEDPVRLVLGPGGVPESVRLRRPPEH